jgi:acetyl esterase/lipase
MRHYSALFLALLLTPVHAIHHLETTMSTTWIPLLEADAAVPAEAKGKLQGVWETEEWESGRLRGVVAPRIGLFLVEATGPRPCVVICPGGGYGLLSMEKEGYEVAATFNRLGMHAAVLVYRLKEFGYPAPLVDTTRAIRHLRANAERYQIAPDQIGIMGFSAGGHAAALASTSFDSPDALVRDALDSTSARPDFSILAYPVITSEPGLAHEGSIRNLFGDDITGEQRALFSRETKVGPETPPTFLMHSADDASVPVENSLRYANALSKHGIPFSLHIYPHATHGMGMREGFGSASTWPEALTQWLAEIGLIVTPAP